MQAGPFIPAGIQWQKAAVGPASGPTRRLSHLGHQLRGVDGGGRHRVGHGAVVQELRHAAVLVAPGAGARKVLGWPKRCKLAHAFLQEYSHKRLKLAQVLGQLGVFLTRAQTFKSSPHRPAYFIYGITDERHRAA